eukprot:1580095-Prymnesium_polylepis.1
MRVQPVANTVLAVFLAHRAADPPAKDRPSRVVAVLLQRRCLQCACTAVVSLLVFAVAPLP